MAASQIPPICRLDRGLRRAKWLPPRQASSGVDVNCSFGAEIDTSAISEAFQSWSKGLEDVCDPV